ncbi:uncharacterized protein LY89DRAFT_344061 [Mollisia scopiformis]|uniref:Uncharacterized protein n=1 Tax=Mollisia scopiformis TaxID=149040 RepID=A0A132B688_MOLSC|nr:uncharacterized protein LY89DRAFT_344061 [Mollisia scopiformis]KUJ07920.1 hypothetical protein LY89DRAFT_344061 [Mollisia scopiformis]
MTDFSSLGQMKATKRLSPTKPLMINTNCRQGVRDVDLEKHGYDYDDDSDDESDYSSYTASPVSSRETSASYSSQRPMLRRRSIADHRPSKYRLPNKIIRYLCLALISTLVIFMLSLIRMSIVSSRRVEVGDFGERPAPPPPTWQSFEFLSRYYGGIRTLVPLSENIPEYPSPEDEPPITNDTSTIPVREIPSSRPYDAYQNQTSKAYLSEHAPAHECFLDAHSTLRVPPLQHYQGRPSGFPDNVMGSYELLGLPEDVCFERYGRLGPYGYGYALKYGGTGTGLHGDVEGSESVWESDGVDIQVDYRDIDWAEAQKRCYTANSERFEPKTAYNEPPTTFSVLGGDRKVIVKRDDHANYSNSSMQTGIPKNYLPRTAVVIRSWDDFQYREEDILHLRAMISELSLGSGGEYDVHLVVQVRDEGKHPIWADADTYQEHIRQSVPKEFWGITTLWSETQMLNLYQGMFDTFIRDLPVHGSYRGLQMAMQHFAHIHPEYDYFWHWEIDIRYTGHYYNFFSQVDSWAKKQPRKGLWERNSRFYVPSVHGSWEDFKQMVRVQTEMGTDNAENIWSGIKGAKTTERKGDKPIWGPERPQDPEDWFEIEDDPTPPTTYDKDKYKWGVDEEADLITFNPLFDPEGTSWFLAKDITGYNASEGLPPRRAAIVSASRMSKRLLRTMHRETAFKKHHAFSEMWAPTTALHHGYKAVYVPHPMFVDREWPTAYLAGVMNSGRNGATGGSRTSVFGEREHNLMGMTWYYNAGFAPNLWKRWLGLKVNNEGGEEFELTVDEGRSGKGVNQMRGGEGRMCLPPMLIHPVKSVEIPVEGLSEDEEEIPESDPAA